MQPAKTLVSYMCRRTAFRTTSLISPQHRGWLKPGASKMQQDAKADLKESFVWGHQNSSEDTPPNDHPLRGSNQWPTNQPDLEPAAMAYFDCAHKVAFQLMRGFALGLDLPENFFLRTCTQPLSRASFVYYPPQPESLGEDQFGVAPHTDFGVLTVLCQDSTGGLQVEDKDGNWIVNTSGKERMSLVLAFDPNPDTVIDANDIPGLSSTEPPITCGDYLQWRFAKAFSYSK